MYSIIYATSVQHSNSQFLKTIVIIKHWLQPLCCTGYRCSLFCPQYSVPLNPLKNAFTCSCPGFPAPLIKEIAFSWCLFTKLCPTLQENPVFCSPPGPSVHGVSQARLLGWIFISFSKGSSQHRDQTHVSCIGWWILYRGATWETHLFSVQIK